MVEVALGPGVGPNIALTGVSNGPQLANARKLQQVRDPKVPVRLGQFGPPIRGIQERRWILAEELEDDLSYDSPAYLPQIFTPMLDFGFGQHIQP